MSLSEILCELLEPPTVCCDVVWFCSFGLREFLDLGGDSDMTWTGLLHVQVAFDLTCTVLALGGGVRPWWFGKVCGWLGWVLAGVFLGLFVGGISWDNWGEVWMLRS